MSKKKETASDKKLAVSPEIQDILDRQSQREFKIVKASMRDGFCDYTYEVTDGVGKGSKHSVEGTAGFMKHSLKTAFERLNVFLAWADDIFKHSKNEDLSFTDLKSHEFTFLYVINGFQIKGGDENESVVLYGTKYLGWAGDRSKITTPKIVITDTSSYKWFNELKEALIICRDEVAKYEEGNYEPVEEEEKPDPKQTKIKFMPEEVSSEEKGKSIEEFEKSEF